MSLGYTYDLGSSSIATTLLMIYVVCIVTGGLISLASYILRGIGFYTIAKEQGDENAWLAFVPFARKYQQGELAGEIQLKTRSIRKTGVWVVGLPIAWSVLSYIIGILFGISIIAKTIHYGILGYSSYDGQSIGVVVFLLNFMLIAAVYKIFYKILLILVNTKILSGYTKGNMPLIHSIFAAFVPLYEAICFFVISRKIANREKINRQGPVETISYEQIQEPEEGLENAEIDLQEDDKRIEE